MSAPTSFSVLIKNGSGLPDSSVYVTAFGSAFDSQVQQPAPPAPQLPWVSASQSFIAFTEGQGSLVTPAAGTSSLPYAYPLDSFPASGGGYTLSLPACSGRIYLSVNAPLCMAVTTNGSGDVTITDPVADDPNDPNFQMLYDKVQFNWNPAVTTAGIAAVGAISTTAVDFFGLPITLSLNGGPAVGVSQPLSSVQNTLLNGSPGSTPPLPGLTSDTTPGGWGVLPLQGSNGTVVRVLSPAYDPTTFTQDVLAGYIQAVWEHYADTNNQPLEIYVDVQGDASQTGTYVGQVTDGNFVFTNSSSTPAVTVSLPLPDTATVFSCSGPGSWGTGTTTQPSTTTQLTIVSVMTAALNLGILPLPGSKNAPPPVLTNDFSKLTLPAYYTRTEDGTPAYNLYAALLHSGGSQVYAFATDNVAGESGQLFTNDPYTTATLTLNSLAGVTPPPLTSDTDTFDVTLVAGAGGSGSVFYGGQTLEFATPASGPPPASPPESVNLPAAPATFTVSYAVGGGAAQSYTVNMVTQSVCPPMPAVQFTEMPEGVTQLAWPGS